MASRRLQVFDLDGTLLRDFDQQGCGTAALLLSRQAGCHRQILLLEQRLAAGACDHVTFAAMAQAIWGGQLTPEGVQRAFDEAPWLSGVQEVLSDIRARGEHSAVVTLGPSPFAELLAPYTDTVVATPYPAPPSAAPLDLATALEPRDKVAAVRTLQQRLGVSPSDTIVYGDGPTDLPLFRQAGLAVGVNASSAVPADATHISCTCTDLRDPYERVRTVLDEMANPSAAAAA